MKFCVSGLANLSAYKIKPQMLVVAVAELDVVCTSMLRDFDFRYYKNSVAGRKKSKKKGRTSGFGVSLLLL